MTFDLSVRFDSESRYTPLLYALRNGFYDLATPYELLRLFLSTSVHAFLYRTAKETRDFLNVIFMVNSQNNFGEVSVTIPRHGGVWLILKLQITLQPSLKRDVKTQLT